MAQPSCPVCAGTGQVYVDDYDVILGKPITRHEPCPGCTVYPWVVLRECRRCRKQESFRVEEAWRDKRGVRWARYCCPQGYQDYWTVTHQVYEVLVAPPQPAAQAALEEMETP